MKINNELPLCGVITPLLTPLDKDENIDKKALKKLIDHIIGAGVRGLFLGGSAGMGPMLTGKAWTELMESALEFSDGRCHVMGGIIETSTKRAIEKINILDKIGYKIMVVTPTFYITLERNAEFISHFSRCREASDMDMIIYNIPGCTGSSIPLESISEIAKKGWITGIKESSGDQKYFSKLLELKREVPCKLFMGHEGMVKWGLENGADGIVPVCSNFDPELFVDAYNAGQKHDIKKLESIQKEIDLYRKNHVFGDGSLNWIPGILKQTVTETGIGKLEAAAPLNI